MITNIQKLMGDTLESIEKEYVSMSTKLWISRSWWITKFNKYPMFNVTYVLKNEDMVEGDLIEIQTS